MRDNVNNSLKQRAKLKIYFKSELEKLPEIEGQPLNFRRIDELIGLTGSSSPWCNLSVRTIPSRKHYNRLQLALNALMAGLVTYDEAVKMRTRDLHSVVYNSGIPLLILPEDYSKLLTEYKSWSINCKLDILHFTEAYMTYIDPKPTLSMVCDYIENNVLHGRRNITPASLKMHLSRSHKFDCDRSVRPSRWFLTSAADIPTNLELQKQMVAVY